MKRLTVSWALLACLLLAVPAMAVETTATGKVVATVTRDVRLPFNAVIDEVLVRPGDAVKSGDPLVRYHLQDEAERVLQREVTTGAATESLRGQILDLERELVQTRAERNRASQLAASGLGSRQALGRLEENVRSLQHRIELTQLSIKKSEESFRARLKELEGYYGQPIREGEMLPDQLVLTSPIDGYVLQLMPNLNPDVLLPAQATPVTVGQLDPVLIQVPVYEGDLGRIKEGGHARVEIPSLGDKVFSATITEDLVDLDQHGRGPALLLYGGTDRAQQPA